MTWSRWKNQYKWFDIAVSHQYEDIGDTLEQRAIDLAVAGDTKLLITLLKRFKKDEYSEKSETHKYQYDPAETLDRAHERARALARKEAE